MQQGILGVPKGRIASIDSGEAHYTDDDGNELERVIRVQESDALDDGHVFYHGKAYQERVESDTRWSLDEGTDSIAQQSVNRRVTDFTEFVAVSAGDNHGGFVVVDSGSGTFVFDALSLSGPEVVRAEVDVGGWLDERDSFSGEAAGAPVVSESAEYVMVYGMDGEDVMDDDQYGSGLSRAADSGTLSPVSGRYEWSGATTRVNITDSGYVAMWEPKVEPNAFASWVACEILPSSKPGDDE